MSSRTRLGIIGAGGVVAGFHLPVLAALDSVEVRWVADLDKRRASEVAQRFHVSEVVTDVAQASDVDAVLVATPVGSRVSLIDVVASRRWHAFCEKPFASSVADHERMLATLKKAGCHAGIGLVRRFYTSTRSARHVVASQILGPVESVLAGEGIRARKFGRGEWFQSDPKASGGGVFAETGTHLVDQVFNVLDVERADLQQCRQERVNGLEMDTRLTASLLLRPTKQAVPLTMGVSRLHDIYNGIVVRCKNGEVRLPLDPEAAVDLFDQHGAKVGTFPGAPKPGIYAAIREEWLDFLAGMKTPGSADTGLMTTRFIGEVYARATVRARQVEAAQ